MTTITPYRSGLRPGRDGFAQLVHAEWTKFRSVRGWIIGLLVAILVTIGIGLLAPAGDSSGCQQAGSSGPGQNGGGCGGPSPLTLGPGGEPVNDEFYFVHQPLAGDGSITVRVTSLTGQAGVINGIQPWSKGGVIIGQNQSQGSPYAAMMVTADHGVRMQWNYTGDTPGLSGAVGPADPRWLRLTRSGDVITGYDSADGTHWTRVGAVTLSGLPDTVQAGLFTASPEHEQVHGHSTFSGPTQATAVFDHLALSGARGSSPAGPWTGTYIHGDTITGAGGSYHQASGQFTVTGSGDIAPIVAGHGSGAADPFITLTDIVLGTFAGLIAIAVVAAMFITGEYRRGLIRTTLAASPRRGRVLAAKAIVIGAVSFVAGLIGTTAAVLIGSAIVRARGNSEFPEPWPAEVRVIIGSALLVAVAAVLILAIGTIVRRGAATIAIAIVVLVVPYFLTVAAVLPLGVADWVLRITPAAGFALQGAYPTYEQVSGNYTPWNGYYPLAPWAGLAVLAAWAAVALAGAAYLLRRRDT
jgi:ABC-type transport system involved in multi-copper enzyme maturation permease subunit/regulation of enolase protein 1 (concanavalin A-like superfamily)